MRRLAADGGRVSWTAGRRARRGRHRWEADQALTALYDKHYWALTQLAVLLVDDIAVAEEVAQAAFVAMRGVWRQLLDGDRALSYLRRAVISRARSHRAARPGQPQATHQAHARGDTLLLALDRPASSTLLTAPPHRRRGRSARRPRRHGPAPGLGSRARRGAGRRRSDAAAKHTVLARTTASQGQDLTFRILYRSSPRARAALCACLAGGWRGGSVSGGNACWPRQVRPGGASCCSAASGRGPAVGAARRMREPASARLAESGGGRLAGCRAGRARVLVAGCVVRGRAG